MPQIYLCFLWHMHQPFYKDLVSGEYKLPWTRMHALKDYYGMVQILEEFPAGPPDLQPGAVHDGAGGGVRRRRGASIRFCKLALKPAEELTDASSAFLLRHSFYADPQRMIYRYPRYGELYDAWQRAESVRRARRCSARRICATCRCGRSSPGSTRSFRQHDPEVRELDRAGPQLHRWPIRPHGRKAARDRGPGAAGVSRSWPPRGQIEISTTPFYHPILPLLCDSNIAGVSHPGVPLPPRFRYPQDARLQLAMAREYMRRELRRAPVGLWPSEGSVSDEVFAIAAEVGLRVGRHRQRRARPHAGPGGSGVDGLYRPYLWRQGDRRLGVIFRDHFMSDLIGFVYSKMDAARGRRRFPAAHSRKLRAAFSAPAAMRWCPSFSTAKTPGNITTATAARSCASCTAASPTTRSMRAVTVSEALRADGAGAARSHLSRLVDQRQFRCLDRRRGRQPGLDAAAARAPDVRRRRRRSRRAAAPGASKNC